MKLELLTNATVVDDAIRFESVNSKSTTSISPVTETTANSKKNKTSRLEKTEEAGYFQKPPNQVF
jgi:hypothetical protein